MLVAVSDIHGHYAQFCHLMDQVFARIEAATDTVVFLGDYVDGGAGSAQVIDQLRRYQAAYPHWVFLMGNHEHMVLDALRWHGQHYGDPHRMWVLQGGRETIQSYCRATGRAGAPTVMAAHNVIPPDVLDWLAARPTLHETERFVFVHAGLEPGKAPAEAPEETRLWIREPFIYSAHDWGKRVIYGHSCHDEPLVMPNKIGTDTMHHERGMLTAVLLDEETPDGYEFLHSYRT